MTGFMVAHQSLVNGLVAAGGVLGCGVVVYLWERFDHWRIARAVSDE